MTPLPENGFQGGLLAFLAEAGSDAVIGFNREGAVASWNPAAERTFGYTADEAIGQSFSLLLGIDEGGLLNRIAAGGRFAQFETQGACKDGRHIDVSVTAAPMLSAQGQITGGVMVIRSTKALTGNEDRYRKVAEITQEAWWEEDLLTGIMTTNPRFCQMLGLDDTTLSLRVTDYIARIHLDDVQHVQESFERANREGTDYHEMYRVRHAAGHYIWVENHSSVTVRKADGTPVRVLGAMADVTARRQAEIALRVSEERYRQVAEITQEAWWEEDIDASILTNSRRFRDILGCGEDILECTVAAYRELIHPDDRNHTRAAHDRAVFEGADYRQVYRLRHADGHYVWVEDLARVIARDGQGRATRMLGSLTDITTRKKAQIALQESEENFRRLFDDAPDAYVIMDQTDLSILACNHAAARLLQASRQQVLGMRPEQLSPPLQPDGTLTADAVKDKMHQILEKGYLRFEFMHRRFDGSDFWAEITAGVGSFRQRPVFYITWREIGEIIAAKQAAEAANIAKSQFLSVMSHELRTPLNAIMGMFQLIEMSNVSDKVRDFVSKGLNSSDHLLHLVDDILDFSSIEAGRLAVERKPFRLGKLLEEVTQVAGVKNKPNVALQVKLDERLSKLDLLGDALRLKQVLINLLGNAIKFTDRGSIVVSVSQVGGTPEAPLLNYAVEDTGIGLTPAQQSRLFQPFTQLDMSNARRFSGTGLGLVISQRLVKMLGGEPIKVESKAGSGSCFAFRLALPVAGVSSESGTRTIAQPPASTTGRLAGLRLLIVEDNEPDRFLLRLLLESEGAVVEQAEDGVEGVSTALSSSTPFDIVLMDMQMPKQDGLGATRKLRGLGYRNPIVALTANAFARDREACLAAGMNDHVTKPVKIDDLVSVLQRYRQA